MPTRPPKQVIRTVEQLKAVETAEAATADQPEPVPADVVDVSTGEVHELPESVYLIQNVYVEKTGEKKGRPWTLWVVQVHTGEVFTTFDEPTAQTAEAAWKEERPIEIITEQKRFGLEIVSLSTRYKDDEDKVF